MDWPEIDVAQFIQTYPDRVDPRFSYKIARLKEFADLKLAPIEPLPQEKGIPLKHQEMMSRYFSPYTSYKSSLLWHSLGSGKTCASGLVVEHLKETIMKGKKGPVALVLVKNDAMVENYAEKIAEECTKAVYTTTLEGNEDAITRKKKIKEQISKVYEVKTWGKLLSKMSSINAKRIKEMYSGRVIIIDEAHHLNTVISGGKTLAKEQKRNYTLMHKFLHTVEDCRVLLLTGTPVWDKIEEIASLFNLILPEDEQFPLGKNFLKRYFKRGDLRSDHLEELKNRLRGRISFIRIDLTKRIDVGSAEPWLKFLKVYPDAMSDFQYQNSVLSQKEEKEKQKKQATERARKKKGKEKIQIQYGFVGVWKKEKKAALLRGPREASNFVYPDIDIEGGEIIVKDRGIWGFEGFKKYAGGKAKVKIVKGQRKISSEKEYRLLPRWVKNSQRVTEKKIQMNKAFVNLIRQDLKKFSTKLASVVEKIKKHPKELVFIFAGEFVKISGSGAIQLGAILELLQDEDGNPLFERAITARDISSPSKGTKRFAVLTSDAPGTTQKGKLGSFLKTFNKPANKYGDFCQIIIGSQVIAEGIDIKNIRQVHIFMPHWNFSKVRQALGRAFRLGSHNALPVNEREVKVYHHVAVKKAPPGIVYHKGEGFPDNAGFASNQTTDIEIYQIAERKETTNAKIYRLMKKIAWDCPLSYRRNVLATDEAGSRTCDYQDCNYECDGFPPSSKRGKVWKYNVPGSKIERSNYDIFYSSKAVEDLKKQILILYRSYFRLDLVNIVKLLQLQNEQIVLLLQALDEIIEQRVLILNRYGFRSYLKEKGNVYFLDTQIDPVFSYQTALYTEYPLTTSRTALRDLIQIIQLEEDKKLVCKFATKQNINDFYKLNPVTQTTLLEWIAVQKDIEPLRKIREMLNREIKKHFYKMEDGTFFHELQGGIKIYDVDNGEWVYATHEEINEYEEEMQKKKAEEEHKEQWEEMRYDFVGIISGKGKNRQFKIKTKKTIEKKEKSREGKPTGRVCQYYRKPDLLGFFFQLGFYPTPHSAFGKGQSRQNLISLAKSKIPEYTKYKEIFPEAKYDLENLSTERIRELAYLFTLRNKIMCDKLEEWFLRPENQKYLRYE